jgi:NodT family efflux transporter outer membrane factor (OMF) lipoprotein
LRRHLYKFKKNLLLNQLFRQDRGTKSWPNHFSLQWLAIALPIPREAAINMMRLSLKRQNAHGPECRSLRSISSRLSPLRFFPLLSLALSLPLSACISLAPETQTPEIVSALPQSYGVTASNQTSYKPASWWKAFKDPVLDALVDDALNSNLDVAESVARLEQVSAQARIARSALLPSIDASLSANRTSTPLAGSPFGGLGGGIIDRIENTAITPSLGIAYELDLFGRNRNDFAAARQDAIASGFDLRAVQLTAAAETISAYFDVVDTRRQIALSGILADILQDRSRRTEEAFRRGLAESFELFQIRQELRATQAALPQLESALANSENRLALLTGGYPETLRQKLAGPLTPRLVFADIPAGLPVNLLSQRPDIEAAWARLDAARLRIGARKAERFPQISLSAAIGTQGNSLASALNLADNWSSSLAANIVAPIFNAGRISANIRSARAQYDQQAAIYARSVLTAFQEVSSAITDYEKQRQRYVLVTSQLQEAQLSLDLQKRRFASGVGTYISYLDALVTTYRVEADLSTAARSTALARLNVHRALAGNWALGDKQITGSDQLLEDGNE